MYRHGRGGPGFSCVLADLVGADLELGTVSPRIASPKRAADYRVVVAAYCVPKRCTAVRQLKGCRREALRRHRPTQHVPCPGRQDGTELRCHGHAQPGGWVSGGVHGAEAVDAHPRVALSGFESGVPEHLGDVPDVCASLQHQGRHRVAKQMAASSFVDPGPGEVAPYLARQLVRAQRCASRGQEQVLGKRIGHDTGTDELDVV